MTPSVGIGLVVAGAVGAPCRYVVDGLVQDRVGADRPWGTFVVNISGALLLGLITGAGLYHAFSGAPKIWLGTGFCGAYTTFSTYTFETVRLVEARASRSAAVYAVSSVLLGGLFAAAGLALAALL